MPELLAREYSDLLHDPNFGQQNQMNNSNNAGTEGLESFFGNFGNLERINSNSFKTINSGLERGNSAGLKMERNNSLGLFANRQVSFDTDLYNLLQPELFGDQQVRKQQNTGFYQEAPLSFAAAPVKPALPEHSLESSVSKPLQTSGEKPKVEVPEYASSFNLEQVVPQKNVMLQKNVKYYGLCEHKNPRKTCKECLNNQNSRKSLKRSGSSSHSGGRNTKKRRPMQFWTKEEDVQLWNAIKEFGTRKWMQIAKRVPGKDHKQCLQRWNKVLNPKLKKGRWKEEEDKQLVSLVLEQTNKEANKSIKWNVISEAMGCSRSAKQCRERWVNHLNPEVKKVEWSEEEDRTLLALHEEFPNKWANISRCLPGRSESMVKSRLTKLTKAKNRKNATGKRGKRKPTSKKAKATKENDFSDALQLLQSEF